jgi:hypothetical protein
MEGGRRSRSAPEPAPTNLDAIGQRDEVVRQRIDGFADRPGGRPSRRCAAGRPRPVDRWRRGSSEPARGPNGSRDRDAEQRPRNPEPPPSPRLPKAVLPDLMEGGRRSRSAPEPAPTRLGQLAADARQRLQDQHEIVLEASQIVQAADHRVDALPDDLVPAKPPRRFRADPATAGEHQQRAVQGERADRRA